MSADSMEKFRCWSAREVGQSVYSDIGAIPEGMEALFLAAHTPMTLSAYPEYLGGASLPEGSVGERQVIDVLIEGVGKAGENTLIAVTGPAGSGKSHVVRWVHANISKNDDRFVVLYVPRGMTIREVLRRLISGLPGVDGNDLLVRVEKAFGEANPQMMLERLVHEMKMALNYHLDDKGGLASDDASGNEGVVEQRNTLLGFLDENNRRRNGLGDLLENEKIAKALMAPRGRLANRVATLFGDDRSGDHYDEVFEKTDLPLGVAGVREQFGPGKDGKLRNELWKIISAQPETTLSLLEEALLLAEPRVVGIEGTGGESLAELFIESRKALKTEGKELVLLFEDLVQIGGTISRELYEQFVTPSRDELAALRVVFAMTDGAFEKLDRTVQTRVGPRFGVAERSVLDQPEKFVARYLNLVRVGGERTLELRSAQESSSSDQGWMLNHCNTREDGAPCRFRTDCHSSFGSVAVGELGDVGLYPYSEAALSRSIEWIRSKPPEPGSITPRKVIKHCISTVLIEADKRIESGEYPHDAVLEQFVAIGLEMQAFRARFDSNDLDRLHRAMVIWGDGLRLPEVLLQAFSLEAAETKSLAVPVAPQISQGKTKEVETVALEDPLEGLVLWQGGGHLLDKDSDEYRKFLYKLTIDRIGQDWPTIHVGDGTGKNLLGELFGMTTFDIQGARGSGKGGDGNLKFSLTREGSSAQVMMAARWFYDHGHFDPEKAKWMWPHGQTPVNLMVELETFLDQCAESVRERFMEITGGLKTAGDAIGLRALAVAASGFEVDVAGMRKGQIDAFARVCGRSESIPTRSTSESSPAWRSVEITSSAILAEIDVGSYVKSFASVRQGTGEILLSDGVQLAAIVGEFLSEPIVSLTRLESSTHFPVLGKLAKEMHESLKDCFEEERQSFTSNLEKVKELLEEQPPSKVSSSVYEISHVARGSGFLKGAGTQLEGHLQTLEQFDESLLEESAALNVTEVIFKQHKIRQINKLSNSLQFLKGVMDQTRLESKRNLASGGRDLSKIRESIASELEGIKAMVEKLGMDGHQDD